MQKLPLLIVPRLILLTGLLCSGSARAIDGDLEYSAPYIMVDPDTGQVVTVNPGPRPKAHPDQAEVEQQGGGDTDAVLADPVVAAEGKAETTTIAVADTTPAIIALWGALFYVIAGYLLARRSQIHNISINSRHGNH